MRRRVIRAADVELPEVRGAPDGLRKVRTLHTVGAMENTAHPGTQAPKNPSHRETYVRPLYPVAPFDGSGSAAEVVRFGGFPFVRLQSGPWQLLDSGTADIED